MRGLLEPGLPNQDLFFFASAALAAAAAAATPCPGAFRGAWDWLDVGLCFLLRFFFVEVLDIAVRARLVTVVVAQICVSFRG